LRGALELFPVPRTSYAATKIVQLLPVSGLSLGVQTAESRETHATRPVIALALLGDGGIRPVYLECADGQTAGVIHVGPGDALIRAYR
jgi:hypothetical protein